MKKFISPAILIPLIALAVFFILRALFFSAPIPFPPNTTIVKTKGGDYAYENKTNTFETQFKESPTAENSIVFENNLGDISFYTPSTQSFGQLSQGSSPTADGSSLTYPEIFAGIDLKYTITSSRLLEEFIVKDASTAAQITRIEQRATTKSTYVENDDGSITFYRKNKEVFTLPHPVMYETGSPGVKSEGIVYEIKPDGDQLIITKVITEEGQAWLADPARTYPIAIDLVIDNGDTSSNWASSDATNTTVSQETTIKQEGSGSVKVQTTAGGAPVDVDLFEYVYPATGGTITTSGGYTIHTFTSSGTFIPGTAGNVEVLVVAGGGSGGTSQVSLGGGGGGGGGGLIYNASYSVTSGQAITVTVGAGGLAVSATSTVGNNGNNSVFGSLTAIGGGGGGKGNSGGPPSTGGSGGGAGYNGYTYAAGAAGTSGQGNKGGDTLSNNNGGGGGGAGGVGGNTNSGGPSGNGGLGGAAASYSISGTSVPYAKGGEGGSPPGGFANGVANTGNGGTGVYAAGGSGAGGSGIVIVRYPTPSNSSSGYVSNASVVTGTGGSINTNSTNIYPIHTFTTIGTTNFTPRATGNVEVLVVAGGGSGGTSQVSLGGGGGGGAGGLIYNSSYAVTSGTPVSVTVGAGGTAVATTSTRGNNGANSVFGTITATGGGGGGTGNGSGDPGATGGSGGGAGYYGYQTLAGAAGTSGQGNKGGDTLNNNNGGGGGGAGGVGGNTDSGGPSGYGGLGGAAASYSISGTSVPYAKGGEGGSPPGGFANGVANTGNGGTGVYASGGSGAGGSGVVIVGYSSILDLQVSSEGTTKTEGSYSLKGVANITTSLNKTLTRTIASPLNLSDKPSVTFDLRASRTGSNIKVGLHDSGGTTTEVTPNITSADTFQSATVDLSGVTNANKDAIDQIIITIVNADATNTFYLDNMTATASSSLNDTVTRSTAATDLSGVANITYWVRSSVAGSYATFGFGESAATEQTQSITINEANTWEQKSWDVSGIAGASRDAVTKFAFTFTGDTSGASFYFDDIQTNALFAPTLGTATGLTDTSIRWNFTDNSNEETGFKIYDSTGITVLVTCANTDLTYCDETGLTPNTQYTRKIGTYNASSTSITSGTVSGYTLAAVPALPALSTRVATTININPDPSTNPAGTQMAIYRETGTTCDGVGGVYLAANGSSNGATAVWQTDAQWSTVTATGLSGEQAYSFCIKARNGDNVETAFSPVGSYNAGFIPLGGNYICTQDTVSSNTLTNRYVDGGNAARYVIALDGGTGSTNNAVFEAKSCIMTLNSTDTLVVGSLELSGGSVAIATGGQIKIGQPVWAIDADGDGYTADTKLYYGTQPAGGVRKNTITTLATADCGDSQYATNNVCCTVATRYRDADGDTYGNPSVSISACTTAGYVDNNTDCNDASAGILGPHTANQLRNDWSCNGACNMTRYYYTATECADNYYASNALNNGCSPSHTANQLRNDWFCNGACNMTRYYYSSTECADTYYASHANNNGCSPSWTYYRDADGDGYGSAANGTTTCCSGTCPGGYVSNNSDCNDATSAIRTTNVTGGSITTSGSDKIHTFTGSDTLTVSCPGSLSVQALVVAGGGGGGSGYSSSAMVGGGGGGGGVVYNAAYAASGNITVAVGGGGAPGQCGGEGDGCPYTYGTSGGNGGNSIFGTMTAVGGGGGGHGSGAGGLNGANGGGGGTYYGGGGGGTSGYSGGQGSDCNSPCQGGGGGGGGGSASGPNGGNGYYSTISGSGVYYGGGGAGNGYTGNNGSPGAGGGAVGYVCSVYGSTGCHNGAGAAANTGGGGAGGAGSERGWGGAGGSGIVIIRYANP